MLCYIQRVRVLYVCFDYTGRVAVTDMTTSLDKLIELGSLYNVESVDLVIRSLMGRKRKTMRDIRNLNQFSGQQFDDLYNEWGKLNNYLIFFKEIKDSL